MSAPTTTSPHLSGPRERTSDVPRLGLGVVGLVLTANAVLLAPQLFFNTKDYSEIAGTAVHLAHYAVWLACLVAMSQLYPVLDLRGRDGRRLSPVLLRVAAVGAALAACAQFVTAFVNPFLAAHEPALLDSAPDPILLVPLLVATGVCGLATAAFGILGGVRRALPIPAAFLIALGGVALPVLGPLSNALLGLGFLAVAWRGRWVEVS